MCIAAKVLGRSSGTAVIGCRAWGREDGERSVVATSGISTHFYLHAAAMQVPYLAAHEAPALPIDSDDPSGKPLPARNL